MRSSHTLAAIQTTFDEDNLVANAGLVVPGALAQKLGVAELVDEHLHLPVGAVGRANGGTKAMTVIGAIIAGGDSIADIDILRAGAGPELFDQGRAPSTNGTWLRGFIWASVRMLDKVSRQVLARAWQAGLGPDLASDLTVDFDSTICQVYGTGKQGSRFGYTKVRGYHPLLARPRPQPVRCCMPGCVAATLARPAAPARSSVRPSAGSVMLARRGS